MSRRLPWPTIIAAAVVVFLAGGAYGFWSWREEQDRLAEEAAEEARRERDREEARDLVARLQAESAEIMPEPLRGVALGQTIDEVRQIVRNTYPSETAHDPDKTWLEKRLPNGAQMLFGFDRLGGRLVQIQVLSYLPTTDAIGPHLTSMIETYGRPTGVWTCPDPTVPTRRFTWRRSLTAIMDVFLVYDGRVSITLYIAPAETIGASLQRARCAPVQDRDDAAAFPQTTGDALEAHRTATEPVAGMR